MAKSVNWWISRCAGTQLLTNLLSLCLSAHCGGTCFGTVFCKSFNCSCLLDRVQQQSFPISGQVSHCQKCLVLEHLPNARPVMTHLRLAAVQSTSQREVSVFWFILQFCFWLTYSNVCQLLVEVKFDEDIIKWNTGNISV